MVYFEEHFWGEKYNGFDVLQQNFKLGLNASKEFAEFLKERSSIEETYSKSLLKLATKCSAANSSVGTFEPCWKFLQGSTEKLANVHNQVIQHLNEVSKTVREYSEQQKEKQKQLKDSFATTSEAVLTLQNLSVALLKAKELYQTRSQEVEKCRKDFSNLKDIKNAEVKFKKSTDDYKQLVDKRENARKDFHEKMTEISQKLQSVEEQHLTQMLEILSKYGDSIKVERFLLDQILDEFGRNMVALTVENLLQQFLNLKQTGKDVPVAVDFEEVEMNTMPVDIDAIAQAIKEEKKNKKKERRLGRGVGKKKKEKTDTNGTVEKVNNEVTNGNQNELQLDEEGYVIRPIDTDSIHSSKSKISSSSDSDSDSDDDNQRIQVTIKPVGESKGSNSNLTGDELKKLSATLTLMSPASIQGKLSKSHDKKHVTTWGSHGSLNNMSSKSRSNNDLLSIDKNSDTASLRSLPVNSSIPSLEKVSSTENNFDASFMSSPVSSPTHDNHSLGTSPSDSCDRSVESLYATYDDVPPPLPVKNRTLSLDTAGLTEQGITFEANFSQSFEKAPGSLEEDKSKTENKNIVASLSTEKSASLPLATSSKSMSSLEAHKAPPDVSSVIPPPSTSSSRSVPANATSLPRPKAGQLAPPPLTSSSSSRRGIQASASTGSLPSNSSQSSFSDLMDINFSAVSNTPILAPIAKEKENPTSHWVNPETSEDSETLSLSPFDGSASVPPLVPRRTNIQTPPQIQSDASASNVNTPGLDKAIPIAVAFIETVSGVFKGSDDKSCMIKVTGDMTISFPANIISMFLNNQTPPVLSFLVTGTSSLEQIFPNKALVERGGQLPGGEGMTFKFNMVALAAYLKKQAEQGTKASYYNIDILKYQVRNNGMCTAPLQLSAYWRCDAEQTDLKIDYKYNSSCISSPVALNNVSVVVPVDGGVTIMQSRPTAIWSSEHQRCMWKLNAISASVDAGGNALRARFDVTNGPSTPVPIAVQYTGEGSTLSSLNFDLKSPSYKLSLVKKRFASGKYIVEPS